MRFEEFIMKRYGLYYNYKTLGDVLLIAFEPNAIADEVIKKDDVVVLKKGGETIGINIFNISKIMKIKANGYIPLVDDKVLGVINHILENHDVEVLEKLPHSGFIVAKIVDIEEHPESDHLHICKVDVGHNDYLEIVCGAFNARKDLICVCALPFSFMPSGRQIVPGKLLGIDSYGMLCSGRELALEGYENKSGLLELDDNYKVGSDFFSY